MAESTRFVALGGPVFVGGPFGRRGQDHFFVCSRPTSRWPVTKNEEGAFECYFGKC